MRVAKYPGAGRKLKAVLGADLQSFFIQTDTAIYYVSSSAVVKQLLTSLEAVLGQHSDRVPVYEGEEIVLKF